MLTQGAGLNYLLPQWSPPSNGGSTQVFRLALAEVRPTAMEPASGRREHETTRAAAPGDLRTAMEPAAGRREHVIVRDYWQPYLATAMEPAAGRREHASPPPGSRRRRPDRNGARRWTAGAP